MKQPAGKAPPPHPRSLDLAGVPCPLNWARAKAALAEMDRGQQLELITDDPRAARDIPRAAEAEGHALVALRQAKGRTVITLEC